MLDTARSFAAVVSMVPNHERHVLFLYMAKFLREKGQITTSEAFRKMALIHEEKFGKELVGDK